MKLRLTGTKSGLNVYPFPWAAAQRRVSAFPGAEEQGWWLINKTETLQRLLERSLVSGQLPWLPRDSREEKQVISATVLSTALLARRVPTGLAAKCLEAEWHSLTPNTGGSLSLGIKCHQPFTGTCSAPSGKVPQGVAES